MQWLIAFNILHTISDIIEASKLVGLNDYSRKLYLNQRFFSPEAADKAKKAAVEKVALGLSLVLSDAAVCGLYGSLNVQQAKATAKHKESEEKETCRCSTSLSPDSAPESLNSSREVAFYASLFVLLYPGAGKGPQSRGRACAKRGEDWRSGFTLFAWLDSA